MQLPYFVQEQHAAVRLADCARLWLRHALHAQRTRALVYRVMYTADQRVGDCALIEAHAGRVHLDKGGVLRKGRALRLFRRFQHEARRAGLADARRPIDNDVLRVRTAEDGLERTDPLLLPDNVLKFIRAYALAERLAEPNRAHTLQAIHLLARPPGVRRAVAFAAA